MAEIKRRNSRAVSAGGLRIGGGAPLSIQSMTNTDTLDREATLRQTRALAAAAGLALIALGLLFGRRSARRAGVLLALAMITAVAVVAAVLLLRADFNALFIRFHELVFTNDLWLLDPATDAMIRMLPEPFFEGMAAQGGRAAGIGALAAFVLGALILNIPGRKKKA